MKAQKTGASISTPIKSSAPATTTTTTSTATTATTASAKTSQPALKESAKSEVPQLEPAAGVITDASKQAEEITLSPDEFESALNAARQMMRKGDFEGAEHLFSQCCALLDFHEGEGLHTAYLIVDWAPCLNQLKRFEEALAICARALGIVENPQYQQYEELNQLKVPLFHAHTVACVGLKRFAEGRDMVDSALDIIKGNDPYKAVMLLVKADLLEKEAEAVEKANDTIKFNEALELAMQCAKDARAVLDQAGPEFVQHPIFYKPETSMVSLLLTWGRMDEAEDMQELLIKKMQQSGAVSPPRVAFQTDEFADICLDSGKLEKAEKLYLQALKIWEGVPGLIGQANVNKAKCELAHKVYFSQPENLQKAKDLFLETRQFTEKHMLEPPKSENMELRVQEARFEYAGPHQAGGVSATFVFQVRLKRRIQDKKPRLPNNSKLVFKLFEWDTEAPLATATASSFEVVLTNDILDNDDRSKRVVDFAIKDLRPRGVSYICHVDVYDQSGTLISKLDQHVVSFVDCTTATFAEAKSVFEKHQMAVAEILG